MGTSTSAPPIDVTKYDSPPEKCVFFNKQGEIGLNNDNRIPPTSDPTERRERRLDLLKWHLKNDVVDAAEWITQNQHLFEKEILGPLCVLLVCTDQKYVDAVEYFTEPAFSVSPTALCHL